jgi:hypothetical protein
MLQFTYESGAKTSGSLLKLAAAVSRATDFLVTRVSATVFNEHGLVFNEHGPVLSEHCPMLARDSHSDTPVRVGQHGPCA